MDAAISGAPRMSMLPFFIMRSAMNFWRGVSMRSGRRLLMVTLSAATSIDSDLAKAVRPARAPVEKRHRRARRLDHRRGDVDDAAELARIRHHHRADQERGRQHVAFERGDPRVVIPVAQLAGRRTGVVVDQDVGFGTGCDQRRAPASVVMSAPTLCTWPPVSLRDLGGHQRRTPALRR